MAGKLSVEVQLKSQLEQSRADYTTLKKEGAGGEKTLSKINAFLQRLEQVNLKGLEGQELTKFLNNLDKLRDMMDRASRTLTTYSKEFQKQQDVVSEATKKLTEKRSLKSTKLAEKKEALDNVKLKGHTYFNKESGRQVTNIDTIVDLMKNQLLEIRGATGKKAVTAESQKKILESSGLNRYAEASAAYQVAKQEVSAQEVVLNTAKADLNKLPKSGDIHPVTEEVQKNSATISRQVSQIRQQKDDEGERDIKDTTEAINQQIPVVEKQKSAFGKAFKQFTLYKVALNAAKTAVREAINTIKELDKYLTEQAMVTGMTRKQTYDLVKDYQNLALQCGATTKEIAQVSTEYMKQGKTIQESLVLTEAAVSAAKVARVSVGDSVNYLTTALNGFRLSAEDAMKVSDKFAAVAASSATDYDELAIALSKVASQANLAGMSIDYTTALLTKGLETTREAPETMGTALKTIIARMRELGDYGETLDDGMDINNVESQLAYVNIALRDANGELRSTEDVLDELGKKWDTLDKNQQAAIAKALAGTRQQSRLIAMMEDYERVTELQRISEQSAGATAAQAGTYLEGIEASLNKIKVAWEKIVMTVTDSEFIINVLDYIGTTLDNIGEFLSTDFGMVTTLTIVSSLALSVLGTKMQEAEVNRRNLLTSLKEHEVTLKEQKAQKKALIAEKTAYLNKLKSADAAREEYKTLLKAAKAKAAANKDTALEAKLAAELAKAEVDDAHADAWAQEEIKKTKREITDLKQEELLLTTQITENSLQQVQNSSGFMSALSSIVPVLTVIVGLFGLMNTLQSVGIGLTKLGTIAIKKRTKANAADAAVATAGMVAEGGKAGAESGGLPGFIAGLAIALGVAMALAAVVGGIALGSISLKHAKEEKKNKTAEGAAESVNKLSSEIYKLTQKANEINQITNKFDDLDNKLIKTNADLKEMNDLLSQAGDKLSDEIEEDEDIGYGVGVSEKAYYDSFSTDKGKRAALDLIEQNNRELANSKREEAIRYIKRLNDAELKKILDENTTDSDIRQTQDFIYSENNNSLYDYLNKQRDSKKLTDQQADAVQALTQSILEEIDIEQAWAYAQDGTGSAVVKLTKRIQDLTLKVKNLNGEYEYITAAEILTSDDYSLKEQVEAYEAVYDEIAKMNDSNLLQSFKTTYSQYEYFSKELSKDVVDFIDNIDLSIDNINKLHQAWQTLQKKGVQITEEQWESRFDEYLTAISETNGDVLSATQTVFGEFLDGSTDTLNAFISAYGDIVSTGILNMGQQMEKIQNKINNFYEKALEWNAMSESEKAEFLQDNADLFAGDENLLKAFQSGDYDQIEEALSKSETFQKQIQQQREKIARELLIEEQKQGDDRNEAYIAELKRYKAYLDDVENLFKASLKIRLEQEEKQLNEYKSYLEEQQEALEDSLNKRKEAYQKYFDEVNQTKEDEEYEQESSLLIENLSKLSSSTNATSMEQTKELEKQLEELEKERLETLRERAQEQLLQNMEDALNEINEKFTKLLESNQALLVAMQGELKDPVGFITELIGNKIESGATALQVEDFIQGLKTTYGSVLDDNVNWDAISVREENNQLFLNVNGTDIKLDTQNEQNLYEAIMKALTEIGLR